MPTSETIRVVIIDDHPMFREGVAQMLGEAAGMTVVASGGSSLEAVQLAALHEPEMMLLDVNMPGGGIVAARLIRLSRPHIKLIMLTMIDDEDKVVAALNAGASGFMLKGIGGRQLVDALHIVRRGNPSIDAAKASSLLEADRRLRARLPDRDLATRTLSRLERDWLTNARDGVDAAETARRLGLAAGLAEAVVTAILLNEAPPPLPVKPFTPPRSRLN